jgi:hypothetical protein
MVLVVVDLHRFGIDVRFKGVVSVWQLREGEGAGGSGFGGVDRRDHWKDGCGKENG